MAPPFSLEGQAFVSDTIFDGLAGEAIPNQAVETLLCHLITGFEESLGLGLPPVEAIALVASWLATEISRLPEREPRQEGPTLKIENPISPMLRFENVPAS
jgi:hypothetical protein